MVALFFGCRDAYRCPEPTDGHVWYVNEVALATKYV